MWSDNAKGIAIICGILAIFYFIWQQTRSKVSPEEYAKTLAAKQSAEEQNKKYEAEKKTDLAKMDILEKDGIALAEKSKAKDKKIISLEKFNDELSKAKCAEATEEISTAYGNLWEAKKTCDELNVNCELRLNAMTDLYKKCDSTVKTTTEQLKLQIQTTQDCQEKKSRGSILVWGLFGLYDPFKGEWSAGIGGGIVLGEL